MTDTYKIDKNVPIGAATRAGSKYPFARMKDGDSFWFKAEAKARVTGASRSYAKATPGTKFAIRRDGAGYRIWAMITPVAMCEPAAAPENTPC